MALTKTELRRLLARDTSREGYILGLNVSASLSAITCLEFIDSGADDGKFLDRWAYLPAMAEKNKERRIVAYTPGTGEISYHRPLDATPDIFAEVEIHRFQPTLLNQAIEDALPRLSYDQEIQITPTSDNNVFSLSSYSYIRRRDDISKIEIQVVRSGVETRVPVDWSYVKYDGSTRSLIIYPILYNPGDGSVYLLLTVKKRFEIVTGAESESFDIAGNTREELWVRAAMKAALYMNLMAGTSAAKEVERYQQQYRLALTQLRMHAKYLVPRRSKRLTMTYPYYNPPETNTPRIGWR